jgi:hypothetical protein
MRPRYVNMDVSGIDRQAHEEISHYLIHDPINGEYGYITCMGMGVDKETDTIRLGFSVRDANIVPEEKKEERARVVRGLMDILLEGVFGVDPASQTVTADCRHD